MKSIGSEVGNRTLQNIDVRMEVFGDGFEHQHICDEGCELSIQFHSRLADQVEHPAKEYKTIHFLYFGAFYYAKQLAEAVVVLTVLVETLVDDLLSAVEREGVDHLGTLFRLLHQKTLDEANKVSSITLVEFNDHPHVDKGHLHVLLELAFESHGLLFFLLAFHVQVLKELTAESE